MHNIINAITDLISSLGYLGIFIGMVIESASIPLPSEIIMGFAGFLVYKGEMTLFLAALVGALGNITGSTIMYFIGLKGGRPFVDKHKKLFHLNDAKLAKVDKWFAKWGDELVFVSQLLPGIRTFISLPAGFLKVNFRKFIIYTFIGAFLWCLLLAFVASKLGENWDAISGYIKRFEIVIVIGILALFIYLFRNKIKRLFTKKESI